MEEKIFVIIYEKNGLNCGDQEIRLCKAKDINEAIQIAKEHRERYYNKGWTYKVQDIVWCSDNTAYVYATWR